MMKTTNLIKKAGCIAMLASGLTLSTGSLAMAQGTTKSAQPKEIIFGEADEVEGVLVNPNGEVFDGHLPSKTDSLIKVRQDFIPELLESTRDV